MGLVAKIVFVSGFNYQIVIFLELLLHSKPIGVLTCYKGSVLRFLLHDREFSVIISHIHYVYTSFVSKSSIVSLV